MSEHAAVKPVRLHRHRKTIAPSSVTRSHRWGGARAWINRSSIDPDHKFNRWTQLVGSRCSPYVIGIRHDDAFVPFVLKINARHKSIVVEEVEGGGICERSHGCVVSLCGASDRCISHWRWQHADYSDVVVSIQNVKNCSASTQVKVTVIKQQKSILVEINRNENK